MWCPNCGDEYRDGFTVCRDCDEALVDRPPEAESTEQNERDDELVEVYTVGRLDAELIRSVLEGNGIPAFNLGGAITGSYPLTVGTLGAGRVFVRGKDEEAARDVIRAALAGELTEP